MDMADTGRIITKLEWVTPDWAQRLANNPLNPENRSLNVRQVDAIARDIKAGKFVTTHQGILLGKDNCVLDGNHRLHAIIKANIAVQMNVSYAPHWTEMRELPIDTGYRRRADFILHIPTIFYSVMRNVYRWSVNVSHEPSVAEMKEYSEIFLPYFQRFNAVACHHSKRNTGSANDCSAAFVWSVLRQDMAESIAAVYRMYLNQDFGSLSDLPGVYALCRQRVTGPKANDYSAYYRALRIFNPDHWDTKTLVRDPEKAAEEARQLTRQAVAIARAQARVGS